MIRRFLLPIAFDESLGRQMRFVAGPRQAGKTTLAREQLQEKKCVPCYFNWDERPVRSQYRENPFFYWDRCLSLPKREEKYWVCFDEIHKMPKWKNILKEAFDAKEKEIQFMITGSARLDLFRKSGDSLAGRYFLFHLFPLTLREIQRKTHYPSPTKSSQEWIQNQMDGSSENFPALEALLTFSGFPEPFMKQNKTFHSKWQEAYTEQLIREDLRDLTRIQDLEHAATLSYLLPTKIGSPLSINSLRQDIEVSYNAIKNYLRALDLTYITFSIPPYHRKITRAIKKERKTYLYDWTKVTDESKKFENFVAVHLQTLLSLWNDAGKGSFSLYYVRNKDGKETDFMITHNQNPWLLLEVKLSSRSIDTHHMKHAKELGDIPFVQIVLEKGIAKKMGENLWMISAGRLLG